MGAKKLLGITTIILTMIIPRPRETGLVTSSGKWTLVFGRRKTGKTYLVRNFVAHEEYYFVKRDGGILAYPGQKALTREAFLEALQRTLAAGKTVVVDEFHRLGDDFIDLLQNIDKSGKLILISSTLSLSKKLLSARSPLMGFFAEVPLGLISFNDSLAALKGSGAGKRDLVELAVAMSEPLAADYLEPARSPRKVLLDVMVGSIRTVPALMGEIFTEEERSISAVYEGIARAVAAGKVVSGEIAGRLFSQKLIKNDHPAMIQQYLNNLVQFGILKRLPVWGKSKFVYRHVSPLARLFYYADEKYNLSEDPAPEKIAGHVIQEMMPRLVEDAVRAALSARFGLRECLLEAGDHDIDGVLLRFQRPQVLLEVKWGKRIGPKDIRSAEDNLSRLSAKRRLLFVPDKTGLRSDKVEIIDLDDLYCL